MTKIPGKFLISRGAVYLTLNSLVVLLVPIILLPLISSGYGVPEAGLFLLSLAIVNFSSLLADLGLSTYGVKKYHEVGDSDVLREFYICSVDVKLAIHALLVVLSASAFALFQSDKALILTISFVTSYLYSISPIWVVHARERFASLLVYHLITRSFLIGSVFFCLKFGLAFECVLLLNALGFSIALKWLQMDLDFPSVVLPATTNFDTIRIFMCEIKSFYLNRIAFSLLTYSPAALLGIIISPVHFAAYGVAEYFYKCLLAITQIGNQALYPYVTRTQNRKHYWISFVLVGTCILFLGSIMLYSHATLINILFGPELMGANKYVPFFLILGFVSFLNIFMGYCIAALYGDFGPVNRSTPVASIAYLILSSIAITAEDFDPQTIILIITFCEFISLLIRLQVFRKKSSTQIK